MTLDAIRSDFAILDEWEDRYRYLIELGRALPALQEGARVPANKVQGCASQVWLVSYVTQGAEDGETRLTFEGDSDAHIVKGLIAVLFAMFDGQRAKDILACDAQRVFAELGLADHLTPQRSNGLASMVARMRTDAREALHA